MIDDLPIWFPRNKITFSYHQLRYFVLPNWGELEMGDYPAEPAEYKTRINGIWTLSYRSPVVRTRSQRTEGRHVTACIITAEISQRLDLIEPYEIREGGINYRIHPSLVFDVYTDESVNDPILENEAGLMLSYISGWRRKSISFQNWYIRSRG